MTIIKLIVSMIIRGFLGYMAGGLLGMFILAPLCMCAPVKAAFFSDMPNLTIIFWCHLFLSSVGMLAGIASAIRSWLRKRRSVIDAGSPLETRGE